MILIDIDPSDDSKFQNSEYIYSVCKYINLMAAMDKESAR